ncbi:MAG: hypothetical protein JKY37_04790 [Nannocystaceae bacterium]|nr:hypothetical protein [Nannocystaceae bacterium]
MASAPDPGPAPPGVNAALWREVGWFPAPVAMLSEFTRPDSAAVVRWLGAVTPKEVVCERALLGVDHYFLAAASDDGLQPTHVFYGTSTRADIEACASLMSFEAPAQVRADGVLTSIGFGQRQMWLGFARLGDRTVVVADRVRTRVEAFVGASGRLSHGLDHAAPVVEGLGIIDRKADTWAVATSDATTDLIGVASRVHAFHIDNLTADNNRPIALRVWARFESEQDAKLAKTRLDALVARHETRRGINLHYEAVGAEDPSTVHAQLQVSALAELGQLRNTAQRP